MAPGTQGPGGERTPPFSRSRLNTKALSCDYVIVGAGSAGCVLAGRLSESPDVSVVLLEAGGSDRSPLIAMPMGESHLIGGRHDWSFETEAQRSGSMASASRCREAGSSAAPPRSTDRSTRADTRGTTTSGASSAARAGPTTTSFPSSDGRSAGRKAGIPVGAGRARFRPPGGASSTRSTTPFSGRASRSATGARRTTTARDRKASGASSTRTPIAGSAAARARTPTCARRAAVPTSRSSPVSGPPGCCSKATGRWASSTRRAASAARSGRSAKCWSAPAPTSPRSC